MKKVYPHPNCKYFSKKLYKKIRKSKVVSINENIFYKEVLIFWQMAYPSKSDREFNPYYFIIGELYKSMNNPSFTKPQFEDWYCSFTEEEKEMSKTYLSPLSQFTLKFYDYLRKYNLKMDLIRFYNTSKATYTILNQNEKEMVKTHPLEDLGVSIIDFLTNKISFNVLDYYLKKEGKLMESTSIAEKFKIWNAQSEKEKFIVTFRHQLKEKKIKLSKEAAVHTAEKAYDILQLIGPEKLVIEQDDISD